MSDQPTFRGIPIRSTTGEAVSDLKDDDIRQLTLEDMKEAHGWIVNPRFLAAFCRVSENEARVWLVKNARWERPEDGNWWTIP